MVANISKIITIQSGVETKSNCAGLKYQTKISQIVFGFGCVQNCRQVIIFKSIYALQIFSSFTKIICNSVKVQRNTKILVLKCHRLLILTYHEWHQPKNHASSYIVYELVFYGKDVGIDIAAQRL